MRSKEKAGLLSACAVTDKGHEFKMKIMHHSPGEYLSAEWTCQKCGRNVDNPPASEVVD